MSRYSSNLKGWAEQLAVELSDLEKAIERAARKLPNKFDRQRLREDRNAISEAAELTEIASRSLPTK